MYFASQGKVLNDKKTIEENNAETETTIEMSWRIMRRMKEEEPMETSETEEDIKKRKLKELSGSKPLQLSDGKHEINELK